MHVYAMYICRQRVKNKIDRDAAIRGNRMYSVIHTDPETDFSRLTPPPPPFFHTLQSPSPSLSLSDAFEIDRINWAWGIAKNKTLPKVTSKCSETDLYSYAAEQTLEPLSMFFFMFACMRTADNCRTMKDCEWRRKAHGNNEIYSTILRR